MKRILVIQDVCVMGKTSGNVSNSIFSAMGIETVFVPVFLHISKWDCNDNDKKNGFYTDLSDKLQEYSEYFIENKIHFDGIFVNGCFTQSQIDKINNLIERCYTDDCFIILNINSNILSFKNLYEKSNLLISNINEISNLSENPCCDKLKNKEYVESLVFTIKKLLRGSLVVTDFFINDSKSGIVLAEKNNESIKWFYNSKYNNGFYGLDDIFAAIIAGAVVKRMPLEKAVKIAADFTEKTVKNTLSKPAHNWYGADFEEELSGSFLVTGPDLISK